MSCILSGLSHMYQSISTIVYVVLLLFFVCYFLYSILFIHFNLGYIQVHFFIDPNLFCFFVFFN